jgi:ribosome-binding protein aMBF1 (putative translation factor)
MNKRCWKCKEEKSLDAFYRNKSMKDGYTQMCKPCHSAYSAERRRQHNLNTASNMRFKPFAQSLCDARKAKRLTQNQLGAMIGVTGTQVRLWEKAKAYPRPLVRQQLCTKLGFEMPLSAQPSKIGLIPYEVKNCANCSKPFAVYKRGVNCCSRVCSGQLQSKRQTGKNNPSWNGGISRHGSGYIKAKAPNGHPYVDDRGYVLQHRLVVEKTLGRYLLPHERIHHKNGVRDDNRLENLELWTVGYKDPPGVRVHDLPPHCPTCKCNGS